MEKIPSNIQCRVGKEEPGCAPGFFSARSDIALGRRSKGCCPGYFCPVMLTCMIPCPLGSYCPLAVAEDPPDMYMQRDAAGKMILDSGDKWCSPYAYKERKDVGCGGADKWPVDPVPAFPNMHWSKGSGSIFCDGGYFCTDTVTKKICARGHFCKRVRSSSPLTLLDNGAASENAQD